MDQQSAPNIKIIDPEEAAAVFEELGLGNLPEDRKQEMMNKMIDTVMGRIFERIDPMISDTDEQKMEEIERQTNSQEEVFKYLVSVIPNLDAIAAEEVNKYKQELKAQISTIVSTLDEEASKEQPQQPAPPVPQAPLSSPTPSVQPGQENGNNPNQFNSTSEPQQSQPQPLPPTDQNSQQ